MKRLLIEGIGGIPTDHDQMHKMLALEIEPTLDPQVTYIITHFPESEAALARLMMARHRADQTAHVVS